MLALTTYEWISLALSAATILFAIVSVIIAVCSAKSSAKTAQRQIAEMNRNTRLNIAVETDKLEVESFRITMHMLELKEEKQKLLQKPDELDTQCLIGPNNRERVKLIDAELDRCNRLIQKIGFTQLDMKKAINNLKNESPR